MFHMRKKAVVAAIGALAGLGATGVAHADAYAFASNQITNFLITSSGAFSVVPTPGQNTIASSSFTGFGPMVNTDPQNIAVVSDAPQATSGPGPFPPENTFSQALLGSTGTRSDVLTTAGDIFTGSGVPRMDNVAEGRALTGTGKSGGSAGRNTTEITVSFAGSRTFTFSFGDTIVLRADADQAGESATSSVASVFTITNSAGASVFSFAPDGNLDAGETSDPFSLQRGCSSNSGNPAGGCIIGPMTGLFSATSASLPGGTYTIGLQSKSDENIITRLPARVPEPASLLLFGAGIAGLGLVRRRKSA